MEVAEAAPHRPKGIGKYFWGTIAVLFVLACAMGWKVDRKRRGRLIARAAESADARANVALMLHHRQDGPGAGSPFS